MAKGLKTGGRTKGTPNKATADVKLAAQAYTAEAIDKLAHIMRNSDSDQAQVAAIKEILDRGHGKARQSLEAAVSGGVTVEIVRFADAGETAE